MSNPGPRLALEAGTLTVNQDIDCDYSVRIALNRRSQPAEYSPDELSLGGLCSICGPVVAAAEFRWLGTHSGGGRLAACGLRGMADREWLRVGAVSKP